MTLVGYFNSLRELGGMRRLVDDDVRTRLRKTDQRGLASVETGRIVEELTSRLGSGHPEVPHNPRPAQHPATTASAKAAKHTTLPPIDVLLATNMISVGVDVPRLGLMVVAGQPKTTAEYIQATSRVGREFPGLVVHRLQLGAAARPVALRDRSSTTTRRSTSTSRRSR